MRKEVEEFLLVFLISKEVFEVGWQFSLTTHFEAVCFIYIPDDINSVAVLKHFLCPWNKNVVTIAIKGSCFFDLRSAPPQTPQITQDLHSILDQPDHVLSTLYFRAF